MQQDFSTLIILQVQQFASPLQENPLQPRYASVSASVFSYVVVKELAFDGVGKANLLPIVHGYVVVRVVIQQVLNGGKLGATVAQEELR